MRISHLIGGAGIAVGLSVFGLAGAASAHHPTYAASCTGFTASGTDYPAGSHVTIKTDGATRLNEDFDGQGFTFSRDWNPALDHPWSIVVFSPDGIGNVNASGTQIHCTTTTVPTTAPTTVPPTTVPPTTAPPPTTIPPVDTSVVPPTTAPAVVDSTPPVTPAPQTPPTTACVPPGAPIGPGAHLCAALPATGSGDAVPLVAVGAGIVAAGVLLIAVRRLPRAA